MSLLPSEFLRKDALDCDLTKFPAVVYLTLFFFISRIPFINLGFSAFTSPTDYDVLAVVNSAYLLRYCGVYTVSRFPGYPFYEIFNTLLIDGSWLATNASTMIISFICVIFFAKILNIFKIKNKALLVFTFAFIPLIWINSTITMDYMWSLMFILMGSYLVFSDKYSLAGIAIGFAIGSRFTSAFMIFPVVLWTLSNKINCKKILTLISTASGAALVLFLPVFYKYKLEFLSGSGFLYTMLVRKSFSMAISIVALAFNSMVMELFGVAALTMLIIFVILNFKNKPHTNELRHLLNFCWLTMFIYILLYFIFPYKVAYLIPVVPWGLIALNEHFKKKFTIIICVLLLLNSVVSIEIVNEGTTSTIRLDSGMIIKNYEDRKSFGIEQSKEFMESLSSVFKIEI
jgi:hypothetical protein